MNRRSNGEGTITKRPDGRWMASVQIGGRRFTAYGKTRKEAADRLQEIKRQDSLGLLVEPAKLTVGEFFNQWLDSARISRKPSTIHGYEDVVQGHLTPALGALKLQKLAAQHVVKLLKDKQAEGLSSRRVAIIHAVLHTALAEAVRWKLVSGNVASTVSPPRQEQEERAIWTAEEVRRFVSTAEASEDPYSDALLVVLSLGLRFSEVAGLTWERVDLENGLVTVGQALVWAGKQAVWGSPKSKAGNRSLPLSASARRAVARLRRHQAEARLKAGPDWKNPEGRVLCTSTGGVPTQNTMKRALQRLCQEAGVPRLTVHGLRHQAASLLIGAGFDIKGTQRFMGHSRATTTLDTYAHCLPGSQLEAARLMDVALQGR